MRPTPQVLLAISEDFVKAAKLPVKKSPGESAPGWARALAEESVHARFTFDRLLLKVGRCHLRKAGCGEEGKHGTWLCPDEWIFGHMMPPA
jgi:hypothetical protein